MTTLTKTATALHERLNKNNDKIIVTMNYDGTVLFVTRNDKQIHVTDNNTIDFTSDIKNVAHFMNNYETIICDPVKYYGYFKQYTEEEYYEKMLKEDLEYQKEIEDDYRYDIELAMQSQKPKYE